MKINTTIQVGYFLEDFNITADHRKQIVWVSLSGRPRMISLVQDYKVVDVFSQVNFSGRCSFTTDLNEGTLEAIFRRHLDPVEVLDIYSTPLQKSAVDIVAPVLLKTLEPSIAIPYSCYKVKLDFGGRVSDLITISCR